jgi:hypothetical protein
MGLLGLVWITDRNNGQRCQSGLAGRHRPAPEDRLLPPRARIASSLCAHPTSFTLLISEQTLQKQACIRRNTLLPEQRTYPRFDLPKRRRLRPRSSNHGCPWIQKPSERATVMLGRRGQAAAPLAARPVSRPSAHSCNPNVACRHSFEDRVVT